MKKYFLTAFILTCTFFGIFLRVHQLSVIPASISYDELDHVVNGLAIRYTGKDFQGQHYFWELFPTHSQTYTAELSALWHAVIPFFSSNAMIGARLPNAVFGFLFALLLAIFAYQLFKSKLISITTFCFTLISPWHILISRTAYEAPIALAWLLCSVVFFWQALASHSAKNKKIFLLSSVLTMLASFYTYHGYKIIYPLIFVILFCWQKKTIFNNFSFKSILKFKFLSPLLIIIGCWVLAFSLFYVRLSQGWYGERSSEISFLNTEELSAEVNKKRRDSLESQLKPFFINKGSLFLDGLIDNFFEAFDSRLLFVSGFDKSYNIALWEHGFFYIFQAPLILIGLCWLFKYKARDTFFVSIIILASLLPVLVHVGTSVSLRSNLFMPFLIILAAVGLSVLVWKQYFMKVFVLSLLFLIMLISVLRFQHFYFIRFPIQTIDTAFFEERLMASYAFKLQQLNNPVSIATDNPFNSARMYALFSDSITADTIADWQNLLHDPSKKTYQYKNLTFTSDCDALSLVPEEKTVLAKPGLALNCDLETQYATSSATVLSDDEELKSGEQKKVLILPSPKDNRDYFRVYFDKLCTDYKIPAFIDIGQAELFAVETLSDEVFCRQWTRMEKVKPVEQI